MTAKSWTQPARAPCSSSARHSPLRRPCHIGSCLPRPARFHCTDWRLFDSDLVLISSLSGTNLFRVRYSRGSRIAIGSRELLTRFRFDGPVDNHMKMNFIRFEYEPSMTPWNGFREADAKQHRYTYSELLMEQNGNIIETGQVQDEKNTLPVGMIYVKKWEVRPEVVGPSLSESGLERIELELHYQDDGNQVHSDKEEIFAQPGKGEPWPLELKDPSLRSYTYEVNYVLQNGFERKVGPLSSSDTFLMISSIPPQ